MTHETCNYCGELLTVDEPCEFCSTVHDFSTGIIILSAADSQFVEKAHALLGIVLGEGAINDAPKGGKNA